MMKQITLDAVQPEGITLIPTEGGLKVEVRYQVKAGTEVIKRVSRDIAVYLSQDLRDALQLSYDQVFAQVQTIELG